MCGFAGFLEAASCRDLGDAQDFLRRMSNAIIHRGPDSDGCWLDASAGIGLAHRRLAIVDLSPAGAQPMAAASGRFMLAFNGEIYNHLRLRDELERAGCIVEGWRGHSDTETLLAGFDAWGIEATLQRATGMFAMAVWDRETRTLTMARDRLGEKPLYYGWQGHGNQAVFLFGSELSALRGHPAFQACINRDALALYMRHNCIGGAHSIYSGIYKLKPGHLLTLSREAPEPVVRAWWSAAEAATFGVAHPFDGTPEEAVDALEFLLLNAVGQQMMADVPLGAFLSGGIDSSTIVALMQAQSSRPVQTFSIGFHEKGYNEAEHAKAVAKHLGTDHAELYVTSEQAMAVIPKLPSLYAEPFADSSQIPTFLVSQLARQHVAVSLSGDAGDELFAGYNRYVMTSNLWGKLHRIPTSLRGAAAAGIRCISPSTWEAMLNPVQTWLPSKWRMAGVGEKLHKGAFVLQARSLGDLYLGLVSHWEPKNLVLGGNEPATCLRGQGFILDGLDEVQRMMVLDTLTYLPDDILVKVDRAAMGVSLETRVPFLDHRVVEFAWRLPNNLKLREGMGKWILRQVLYRHVPRSLVERPKMGFGVPIDTWLRGPLRDWAEDLLDESRLRQEGYFNPVPIRHKWAEHISGKCNWQHQLWDILMFQAWLVEQRQDFGKTS